MAARQPATAEAWSPGAGTEHVRIIQRFLEDLPFEVTVAEREKAEAFLAEHARLLRPDQLARLAERLAIELNPDGTFSEARSGPQTQLHLGRQRPDGMTEARLWATPELRSYLEVWLAKYAAPGMCNPPTRLPSPTANRPRTDQSRHPHRCPTPARRSDALLRATLGDPKLGRHNGLPVTVIVSAPAGAANSAPPRVTGGGGLVPMEDVIRMASHAYHT